MYCSSGIIYASCTCSLSCTRTIIIIITIHNFSSCVCTRVQKYVPHTVIALRIRTVLLRTCSTDRRRFYRTFLLNFKINSLGRRSVRVYTYTCGKKSDETSETNYADDGTDDQLLGYFRAWGQRKSV